MVGSKLALSRPPGGSLAAAAQVLVLTALLAVPSYADAAKYAGHHHPALLAAVGTVVLAAAVTAGLRLLGIPRFRSAAGSWPVTAVLLAGITVVSFVLYHREQARIARGLGGTQAQALIAPGQALVHGHHLYSVHLQRGNPVSPGPLWLVTNVPFSFPHLFALLLPFWLAVSVVALRWALRRPAEVAVGLALLCCTSHFYVMLAEGQDLLVIGALMVAAVAVAHRVTASGRCPDGVAVALGIAVAVVANARLIYLPLPILVAWCMSRRTPPRPAVIVGAVGLAVAGGAHLVASIGVHPYPPAHLFGRADSREPAWNIALGGAATAAAVAAAWRRIGPGARTWLVWLAWCLSVPQAFIGLGELEGLHFHLASWEGSNYLFTGVPAVVAAVLATNRLIGRRDGPSDTGTDRPTTAAVSPA